MDITKRSSWRVLNGHVNHNGQDLCFKQVAASFPRLDSDHVLPVDCGSARCLSHSVTVTCRKYNANTAAFNFQASENYIKLSSTPRQCHVVRDESVIVFLQISTQRSRGNFQQGFCLSGTLVSSPNESSRQLSPHSLHIPKSLWPCPVARL